MIVKVCKNHHYNLVGGNLRSNLKPKFMIKELTKTRLFKPISQDDINTFELKNNVLLPKHLQEFFIKYNGSKIKENIYTSENIEYCVSILPLKKNEFDTSVEDFLPIVKDFEIGLGRTDLIPFAADPGGKPFLVSIGDKDYGIVYYPLIGLGSEELLKKIADSFEDFINGLEPENLYK